MRNFSLEMALVKLHLHLSLNLFASFFFPTTDMNNPKIIVAYIVLVFWRDSSQRDNERSYITVASLLRKKRNALSMNQ